MNHHRIRADGALLMIAFVWGATFVLVQGAVEILPPFAFLSVRFGLAALLLWLYLRWRKDHRKAFQPRYLSAGIFLGLWLFVGFAFQTFSLLYTTSGKSGFLTGLSVALIPVFSFLSRAFDRESTPGSALDWPSPVCIFWPWPIFPR